ncbi:carbohydrate kinase family protein [Ruminococcaceae bacterium OttesenSCG-928-I18]|nr:carbohydrate kinase family protein [Ruminococcaceae bacterium OttesenSCG-928-I18]
MAVFCAGQLVADIIVKPVDALLSGQDTSRVEQIVVKNGGDMMNTAISLSRLGNHVVCSGKVGDDDFGRFLSDTLRAEKIDTRGVTLVREVPTSSVIVLVTTDGERKFLYFGGSNDYFQYEDIDLSLLDGCENVHVGGTYNLPRFDGEGAAALFRQARKKGKQTSMDVTWDSNGQWLSTIRPCLPHLDFFMPSFEEAKNITGEQEPEAIATALMEEGVGTVVLKLGKAGCYLKNSSESFSLPAFDVPVVDTTGAGDSFVAGFLTGLQNRWELRRCAQFASAVSAFCIQSLGATTGIPGAEEVLHFLEQCDKI